MYKQKLNSYACRYVAQQIIDTNVRAENLLVRFYELYPQTYDAYTAMMCEHDEKLVFEMSREEYQESVAFRMCLFADIIDAGDY